MKQFLLEYFIKERNLGQTFNLDYNKSQLTLKFKLISYIYNFYYNIIVTFIIIVMILYTQLSSRHNYKMLVKLHKNNYIFLLSEMGLL